MATHGSLGEFDPRTGDWKTYIERAQQYFLANDVTVAAKKRGILLSCVGSRAYRIIKDVLSPTDVDFPTLIERTSKHFQPEPSEIVQRFHFHTRVRDSHESVATYIAQLKQIAGNCNFGETVRVNEMLRDRLVCGIANEKWQQRLLAEEGLTYDMARKLLLALEAAEKGLKDLSVDALRKQVHYTQRRPAPRSTSHSTGVEPYHQMADELSVHDGCILHGSCVVVPSVGRNAVLEMLHEGHPGNNRMKSLARSVVWWPGIDHNIEEKVKACEACQLIRHNPPAAPLHPWEYPTAPWERLHADFAGPFMGHTFFLLIDAYSKWLEVRVISTVNSTATVEHLRSIFATHGLPKVLVSDNGPQFTSAKFENFMSSNGIRHVKSAPYHPASNGLAERAVQVFKENFKRVSQFDSIQTRLSKFLLWYRLTPHSTTGIAPAELLLGRRPRSVLDLMKPDLSSKVQQKQEAQKVYNDKLAKYRQFQISDAVYVKDFTDHKRWIPGIVSEVKGPLSYHITIADGRVFRRHVDHIRPRTCTATSADLSVSDTEIPPINTAPNTPAINVPTNQPPPPPCRPDPPPTLLSRRSSRARAPPNYYRPGT